MFIYTVQKHYCYLSVSTLTSKDLSIWFFVVFLSLNTFLLPFSGILSCKYMNQRDTVAVYILNTRRTPYSLFLTAANVSLIFHAVRWPSKHQPCLSSILETSKYVRRYLVCFLLNRWFLLFCCIFICNYISRAYLADVSPGKTQVHVWCLDFNQSVIHSPLILSY